MRTRRRVRGSKAAVPVTAACLVACCAHLSVQAFLLPPPLVRALHGFTPLQHQTSPMRRASAIVRQKSAPLSMGGQGFGKKSEPRPPPPSAPAGTGAGAATGADRTVSDSGLISWEKEYKVRERHIKILECISSLPVFSVCSTKIRYRFTPVVQFRMIR